VTPAFGRSHGNASVRGGRGGHQVLAGLVAACLLTSPAHGSGPGSASTARPALGRTLSFDVTSTVRMDAEAWLGFDPPTEAVGLIPVVVTLVNSGQRPARIPLTAVAGPGARMFRLPGMLPTATVNVPPGASVRTLVFAEHWPTGGTPQATLDVAPGGDGGIRLAWQPDYVGGRSGDRERIRVAAISRGVDTLAADALDRLGRVWGVADLAQAPADWRAWTLLTDIAMTAAEWRGLSAAAREAIDHWVALGGRVVVFRAADAAGDDGNGDDGAAASAVEMVGVGTITFRRFADGLPYPPEDEIVSPAVAMEGYAYTPAGSNGGMGEVQWQSGFAKLAVPFGPRRLPVVALITFVALFAAVAGPLNVMVLAGQARRARIFWTTPLIALSATGLLLALMFLRDGVGGAGIRRVLCVLLPERNAMAVIQEQFSRTGVLTSTSFAQAEPSWMRPLGRPDGAQRFIEDDAGLRYGAWFRSRDDRGYLLRAVRPGRAGIDVVDESDGGAPALVSSLGATLTFVFYRDPAGGLWKTIDLPTGTRRVCTPASEEEFDRQLRGLRLDAGPIRAMAIDRLAKQPGHVVAVAREADDFAIATLRSIRWQDEQVVFLGAVGGEQGPVAAAGAASATRSPPTETAP